MQSFRLTQRSKPDRRTGSSLDTTDINAIQERPGGHEIIPRKPDPHSELHKIKISPTKFLKGRTGNGGTMVPKPKPVYTSAELAQQKVKSKQDKIYTYPAYIKRKNPPTTELRRFYERGDLPIVIDHGGVANKLAWKVAIEKLDYHHYLPIFMDGLREVEPPYSFLADQGVDDMLTAAPTKVLPVIPQIIIPLKTALNTRDPVIMTRVLKVLRQLVHCDDLTGQALVPYYRQLLPVMNIFKNKNKNLGDSIDYGQRKGLTLGDQITMTLEAMEERGGEDAFINIKYMVPSYQSCVMNN